ncbi:MAG: NAD-dependent epimerase/dehydratase family protein [Candidatus Hodarchaeales archaeon]|jgi:nucleoside-diphosphate-sugar epimerase
MVLFVTGGTGLVGSFLLELIKETSYLNELECRVLVRNETSKHYIEKLGFVAVKANLENPKTLISPLMDVTTIIHLAARADDWATWDELYQVNVKGLENLVTAARNANNDPFVAHASSTGVYGHFIPSTPIDENHEFNPTSNYQKSKYLQEKYLWELKEKEGWDNFSLVRSPSIIGPRDKKTILPIFNAVYQGKFPILRGGEMFSTFIHPLDLSRGMLLLYQHKDKAKGEAFNIKSFESKINDFLNCIVELINPSKRPKSMNYRFLYSIAILSEVYSKIFGKKPTLNRYRVTKFARSRRYVDSKIRNNLGFRAEKNMVDTIDESYKWLIDKKLFPPH